MKRQTTIALLWSILALLAGTAAQSVLAQGPVDSSELVRRFKAEKVFWKQDKIAEELIALHDTRVFSELEPWLTSEDRHIRANVAFVFAALGDDRGFTVLRDILDDFSDRPIAQGIPSGKGSVKAQIEADRYYAVHVFGQLKDRRAVPILVPLLKDKSTAYSVPWALGRIGDRSAIPALVEATEDANPDLRLMAIDALVELRAREALPRLREMLSDNQKIHFDGVIPVSQAAKEAVATLEEPPWPSVDGIPVATRVVTEAIGNSTPMFHGECQVRYFANGKAFLLWAAAYAFFEESVVKQKMSSCPVASFVVRYNPKDPADAVAMFPFR